jgi:hypothetical protein
LARQASTLKFTGTVGDITGYKTKNGYFTRKKSSLSGEKINNSPGSEGTRKENHEFKSVSPSAALLKHSFLEDIQEVYEGSAHNRLVSVMSKVRDKDFIHPKGYKNVATGIQEEIGKFQLRDFQFNNYSHLDAIFSSKYSLNTTEGNLAISELNPARDFKAPKSAAVASLSLLWSKIDFDTFESHTVSSDEVMISLANNSLDIVINIPEPPEANGTNVFVLKLVYYQEINGQYYILNNREFCSAKIIGVV